MYFQVQVQVKELYLNCEEGEIVIVALRVSAMVQIKLGSNFWDILFPPKDEANQIWVLPDTFVSIPSLFLLKGTTIFIIKAEPFLVEL